MERGHNTFLVDSYPSLPQQPALAFRCNFRVEPGKAPNTRPQIKATALSVKIGTALIKVSLNSILQTGNQRVNSQQKSKDEMPFRAKERMSPCLWVRESCPILFLLMHSLQGPPTVPGSRLSSGLLADSAATLSHPLSFLQHQLQREPKHLIENLGARKQEVPFTSSGLTC